MTIVRIETYFIVSVDPQRSYFTLQGGAHVLANGLTDVGGDVGDHLLLHLALDGLVAGLHHGAIVQWFLG